MSFSSISQRPIPKPRKSRDGPAAVKHVHLNHSRFGSNSSSEKQHDSHTDQSIGLLYHPEESKVKKKTLRNVSRSLENLSESSGMLQKSASDSSLSSQKRFVTKRVTPQIHSKTRVAQSEEFEQFASHGLVIADERFIKEQPKSATKQHIVAKNVSLLGNKKGSHTNPNSEEFQQQALLLKESLGSASDSTSRAPKASKEVAVRQDGKRKVNYSSDFEEYSISTLQSLGDTVGSNKDKVYQQKTKVVNLSSDGAKQVSYSQDVEDFTSQTLEDLYQATDSARKKPRQVTTSVNTTDGERSALYSTDFDSESLTNLRSQSMNSEANVTTLTKSKDRDVTSWVEFKDGKRHVRHSDEFENFSLGQAIRFVSKHKKAKHRHKEVEYIKGGQKKVKYNDDLRSSLQTQYSDDFESFSDSWALKVKRSDVDSSSPVTKRVQYKGGKKHVTYSVDLENTLEKTMDEVETATSFREVSLYDTEEESYTEDFESTTAKVQTRSLASASITEDIELLSSSTLTPQTSNQASLHQFSDQYPSHYKDSRGLYSESYASITSLTQSEDVSPRYRTRVDTQTRTESDLGSDTEDESYTMSFSHLTVESIEESPETKKEAKEAQESFIAKKLKLLRTPHSSKKTTTAPKPTQTEKLDGIETRHLKKFVKNKLKVMQHKADSPQNPPPESINTASCQLRGIDLEEPVESLGISKSAIIRLKMENTLGNMKSAVEKEMHDPRVCSHCSDQMANMAAEHFMWRKKAIVSEKLVKEKMEMQMLQLQDPMWLYAEALRGLPHPTDHREDIYGRLMKPLFESYASKLTPQEADTALQS